MGASSKGRVDETFKARLTDLSTQAGQIARSLRQQEQRRWQKPGDWDGNPLDIASMTEPFDRSKIGTNYEELISDSTAPGTIGDVISVKSQGDYLATMERAFRAARATPVRCMAHAAAARKGHGHDKGVFNGGILKYVEDSLQAGAQ